MSRIITLKKQLLHMLIQKKTNTPTNSSTTRKPMYRTGIANLPLHGRKAPFWLTVRMRKLAKEIANIMIEEQCTDTFVQNLSDPY